MKYLNFFYIFFWTICRLWKKVILSIFILILVSGYSALPVLAALNTTSADFGNDATAYKFNITDSADTSITSSLTIEMWLNFTSTTGFQRTFDKENGGTGLNGYGAYWNPNDTGINLRIADGSAACEPLISWSPSTGVWYHWAMVFDDTNNILQMFINGTQQGTDQSCTRSPGDGNDTVVIGNANGGDQDFNGLFDDVRLYNVARTGAAIAADYQQQLVGNETGLVGYWMLNNGAGTCGTTQLEDKGETTDPVGAVADDLTNVNSVQCVTDVPFTNAGAAAAVVPKRRLNVIIIE